MTPNSSHVNAANPKSQSAVQLELARRSQLPLENGAQTMAIPRSHVATRALSRALLEETAGGIPQLEQAMRDDVIQHSRANGWRVVTTPEIRERKRRRWVGQPGDERFVDLDPGPNWDHELWVITCAEVPLQPRANGYGL